MLLQFVHRVTGIEPASLPLSALDADRVLGFLDGLEQVRHNTITSRNLRLTAIRSFYRMVALRDPASVGIATRVLAIPMKRADIKVRTYVTRDEMDAILTALDRKQWCERRDYALLLTMYNSGARVPEICGLRHDQVTLATKTYLHLQGKECHSYCIFLPPRHETTGKHIGQQACDLAFSVAAFLRVVRKGTGLGPYTDAHGASRVEPRSEPYPA